MGRAWGARGARQISLMGAPTKTHRTRRRSGSPPQRRREGSAAPTRPACRETRAASWTSRPPGIMSEVKAHPRRPGPDAAGAASSEARDDFEEAARSSWWYTSSPRYERARLMTVTSSLQDTCSTTRSATLSTCPSVAAPAFPEGLREDRSPPSPFRAGSGRRAFRSFVSHFGFVRQISRSLVSRHTHRLRADGDGCSFHSLFLRATRAPASRSREPTHKHSLSNQIHRAPARSHPGRAATRLPP